MPLRAGEVGQELNQCRATSRLIEAKHYNCCITLQLLYQAETATRLTSRRDWSMGIIAIGRWRSIDKMASTLLGSCVRCLWR